MARLLRWLVMLALSGSIAARADHPLPACLALQEGASIETSVMRENPEAADLLARLTYAEGRSTEFPDDPLVYRAIAWGVMNRVRLAEASPQMQRRYGRGIAGVIFRKGQFNPAISPRSAFSADFLCPRAPVRWSMARKAATEAIAGKENPFIQTPWERSHGLSTVVNFYYPASTQAKGPLAPWEESPELEHIGAVAFPEGTLDPGRVRFYRLTRPPRDVGAGLDAKGGNR